MRELEDPQFKGQVQIMDPLALEGIDQYMEWLYDSTMPKIITIYSFQFYLSMHKCGVMIVHLTSCRERKKKENKKKHPPDWKKENLELWLETFQHLIVMW